MIKMKLFPKIFLYTFIVMLFITILAHIFIYIFAPQMLMSTDNILKDGVLIGSTFNTSEFIEMAILKALPISLIFCTIISLFCSLIFSKALTKPIKQITKTTELMSKLDKEVRCPINSFDEIGTLANNVNNLYVDLISTIEDIEKEKQRVTEIEQSKIDFLRSASHELKTPVTALNAILENMILGVGKYKDKDIYLLQCKDITTNLSNMIKEILDTSRMDFITECENKETFNLSQILLECCKPFELIAKSKHINFKIDIKEECNLFLSKKSLEKILSNLLSNAVSYTKEGKHIVVSLEANKLVIENECKPIPKEKLVHIFEPFYRPDFARDRKDGGNGLGLYFVDILAKTMELRYTFEPMNMPEGMRFTLYF